MIKKNLSYCNLSGREEAHKTSPRNLSCLLPNDIQTIFKVTRYDYRYPNIKKRHWPEFKLDAHLSIYFENLTEAENYIKSYSSFHSYDTYANVIVEIPLGLQVAEHFRADSFSERIYLPDGTLWGINDYANFTQWESPYPGGELELGNYLGKKRIFYGRKPEEIRFKPGDIVEVFGYPGNDFWSDNVVNLAIVVKAPPTIEEISRKIENYLSTHSGYDVSDHSLGYRFGYHLDTYEVIPYDFGGIDHSPTIATMNPSLPVSTRRNLIDQYEKYLAGELKSKFD